MSESSTIKVLASERLKNYVYEHCQDETDVPENIKAFLNHEETVRKRGKSALSTTAEKITSPSFLNIDDLSWLKSHLKRSEKETGSTQLYLHNLLEDCSVILPEPLVQKRNPELEARIQRLKKEQEEREYRAMTKNVDSVRVHRPDDSLASQMKMLNSHMIAVLQFIISVGAGFTFGFLGIELMVGSLDFGFRLLLGVACALTIALAEIYFLAKKLSEDYDDIPPFQNYNASKMTTPVMKSALKDHND